MKNPPAVSVIIPCHNYGRFVSEAVTSALAQTCQPVDVIVVDDGSTDDTPDRLQAFGSRIRHIRQENQGVSAARNSGVGHSRGEWVAFLDADDFWHPQKLEVQFRSMQTLDGVDFFGGPAPSKALPEALSALSPARKIGVRDFLVSTPLGLSSVVVRRECALAVGGFDREFSAAADRDMWLRLAARYSAATIASPCWHYRLHAEQMNRDPRRMFNELQKILRKFFAAHPRYREYERLAWAFVHFDAAIAYRESGSRWLALSHLLRSLASHPLGFGPGGGRVPRLKVLARLVIGERLFHDIKGMARRRLR